MLCYCNNLAVMQAVCAFAKFLDVTLEEAAAVRLVGGASPLEGRVEVFFFGQWGTVCNSYWDLVDATVVCHQLGYLGAVGAPTSATFGAGSGPSWYNNVRCVGTEMNLTECSKSISPLGRACSHSRDAAVMCSSKLYVEYAYISCSAVVIAFVQLDVLVLSIPIKAS